MCWIYVYEFYWSGPLSFTPKWLQMMKDGAFQQEISTPWLSRLSRQPICTLKLNRECVSIFLKWQKKKEIKDLHLQTCKQFKWKYASFIKKKIVLYSLFLIQTLTNDSSLSFRMLVLALDLDGFPVLARCQFEDYWFNRSTPAVPERRQRIRSACLSLDVENPRVWSRIEV